MASAAITGAAPAGRSCAAVATRQPDGPVGWYHPAEAEDNARLEAWCRAVGPVVIDSVPAADFGGLGPAAELRVVAWNTDAGSGDLVAFLGAELGVVCGGERSRLSAGASHFVLTIQEALRRSDDIPVVPASFATPPPVAELDHPGPRLDVVEVAAACGLSIFYAPAGRNGPEPREGLLEDKGNAILATLPLSDFVAIELPYENARRVAPVATVRGDAGTTLRVASVHLITTPGPHRVLVTGNSARMRQTLALVEALRRIDARTGATATACAAGCTTGPPWSTPIVAAGDFNAFSRRETAIRRLRVDFPDSPALLRVGTRGPLPTDHIFFGAGGAGGVTLVAGSYERLPERYFSDHNPVSARFVLDD